MTLIVSCLFAGCDSLANKSEDKLSGDDFWAQGNETNAEAFLLSIYNSFRNATMSQRPFLTYSGDMRCAPITAYSTGDKYVTAPFCKSFNGYCITFISRLCSR